MTEYSGFDVKQLWYMIDAARQGLQPSHDQADALSKAQQMLSGHSAALETAREQLATKWPPESNAASAAYLAELDRLITAVKDTALSCAINVFHINMVSDAIVQTHETLEPLHREYIANEGTLARFEAELDSASNGGALIPGGRTIARKAAKLLTAPPVADDRQQFLTLQTQKAMVSLSDAALDGAAYIKPPASYEPPTVNNGYLQNSRTIDEPADHAGATRPPTITPPRHGRVPLPTAGSTGRPRPSGDIGPELSRSLPRPPLQAVSASPPAGLDPGTADPVRDGSGQIPIGALLPAVGSPTGESGSRLRGVPASASLAASQSVGTPRGGVIGSVPEVRGTMGSATPSRSISAGGVIGLQPGVEGSGAPTAGNQTSNAANPGIVGRQIGRRVSSRTKGNRVGWDPDNPWEVAEGVAAVIEPDTTPRRFDPGRGVIGLDR